MYYIGVMSGTSVDAVDIALVEFDKKANLKFYREYPIPDALASEIKSVNAKTDFDTIVKLDGKLGLLFSNCINEFLKEFHISPKLVFAIGCHGQTVFHKPNANIPTSIQIGDPNIICSMTKIKTVCDFRRMDMAYGGQGAPLTSAFHQYQFSNNTESLVVLNIGGIANITMLPINGNIVSFDTGPGNILLDDWAKIHIKKRYDENGQWATTGQVNEKLLNILLQDPYFTKTPPKSTGREYFNLNWLNSITKKEKIYNNPQSIQVTLLELTTESIANTINSFAHNYNKVLICGGGAYNKKLVVNLKNKLNIKLASTQEYGLAPNCIEATSFAWLAKQRLEKLPANIPTITGASRKAILGAVYEHHS